MYINDNFEISDEEIETKITDKTKIVGITHVSNVLGTINNIEKIIIPYDNESDLDEIPKEIKEKIKFVTVKNYEEVSKEVWK